MPQTKIQGKFYPLTSEVTTILRQAKLTAAEWRIWSYLVEVDPWGDRYQDIDSLDVISKCDCSKATFYRAFAKFQRLKIFDIQDKGLCIRNLTGASNLKSKHEADHNKKLKKDDLKNEKVVSKMRLDSQNCESNLKNEKVVSKMRLDSQNCESNLKNEKVVSKMRLDSQNCENQTPKPPPDKDFESPQTVQTYSDFKQTLSEGERENFFNFVKKETLNLERKINDLEAWLASLNAAGQNRWEIYYRNYQEEKLEERSRTTQQDSSSAGLTPAQTQRAIAEFQKRMKINQPVDEPESEVIESEEFQRQQAEFNKLLDNLPEHSEKSPAQQRRENMAESRRQQEAIRRANREAAEERARAAQQFSIEERQDEIQRQIEEFNRLHNINKPGEIDEEGKDYE